MIASSIQVLGSIPSNDVVCKSCNVRMRIVTSWEARTAEWTLEPAADKESINHYQKLAGSKPHE